MVFLNPAVLFGLIAAAIPVLLHFLNLQKLKKIEFSTLAFLKELQKTKIRKLKFKQWLLLALRVLIILLVVSAFARPTLESVNLGGTSAAKTTSVFILDDSFSMSVVTGNGSYFNNAKQVIKNLVNQLQQGDDAALILTSQIEKGKQPTTSLTNIISELDDASVSTITPDYKSVFEQAKEILDKSDNFNKEVYIFSDFQNIVTKINDDNLQAIQKYFDEQVRIYLFNFGSEDIINAAVTNLQLDNQILETGKTVSFTATVNNLSNEGIGNGIASLFLNGVRSAQQSFNLAPGESQNLTFNTNLKEPGLVEAKVEIEDDDILHDNERFITFYVPEKINVLLLTDKNSDAAFIKTALQSVSEGSSINVTEENLSDLSTAMLNENDVVLIIGSGNLRNAGQLRNYISSGGNVIIFPGSNSELPDFQLMVSELGIPAPTAKLGEENNTQNPGYFDEVEYDHPLFVDLFENRKETKVESPEIYVYFKMNRSGNAQPVITLTDNSLFLSEYSIGSGDVLVFNTAPLLSWNNFPVKSLFAPLINKIVLYQSTGNEIGKQIFGGDEINVPTGSLKLPQLKVIRPGKSEEFINPDELENNRFLSYNKTNEYGVYEFYSGDELIDFVAVNFNPEESTSEYLDEDKIEEFIGTISAGNEYVFVEPESNYIDTVKQARFGTELWKYFLIIALLTALIEMFISKSAKKDLTEIKK